MLQTWYNFILEVSELYENYDPHMVGGETQIVELKNLVYNKWEIQESNSAEYGSIISTL